MISVLPLCASGTELPATITVGGLNGLDPNIPDDNYQIGLALSGGGARGLAAIGILRAFEENGIRVVGVTGTSIGGIVGGLYACGYSPAEMDSIVTHIRFSELFSNRPARTTMLLTQREARERHLLSIRFDGFRPQIPQGLTTGQEVSAIISRLTSRQVYLAGGDFEKLPIPFQTVCTDIVSGDKVIYRSGSMADAIRATVAFPLAFTGEEHGDRVLMDGGMVSPVPVSELIDMVPPETFIVAINSTSPLVGKERLNTPVDIATQVTTIMTQDRLDHQLSLADYVLTPGMEEATLTEMDRASEFVQSGYEYGLTQIDPIIRRLQEKEKTDRFYVASIQPASGQEDNEATTHAAIKMAEQLKGQTSSLGQLKSVAKTVCRDLQLFSLSLALIHPLPDDKATIAIAVTAKEKIPAAKLHLVFHGNSAITDSLLETLFRADLRYLTPKTITSGKDRIIAAYNDAGYELARFYRIDFDSKTDRLELFLDEGIVRRIDVVQNEITKDWLLRSYLPLKVGEPWTLKKATQGTSNIYGSDLFDRVTVELTPSDSGAIVTIDVLEKKYTQVRLGWHWHDVYQSEEFVELLNDNLYGTGAEYLLHAAVGYDRQSYYLQLRANRIFSTYFTGRTRLYYNRIERSIYDSLLSNVGIRDERRWGLSFEIGRHYSRLGTLTAELAVEELEYRDSRYDSNDRFGLRTLVLESLVETFDRATFPESGKRHQFQLSFYGESDAGSVAVFSKYYNSIESYFPLTDVINYHPRVILGFSRTGLPASEKFFLGGIKSFSGYKEHQQTGDKVILLNQELRFQLPHRFYLTGRYDIGDLYESTDDVTLSDMQQGWGGSIALDSPIGPFELGYGKAKAGPEVYYFYAGFEF